VKKVLFVGKNSQFNNAIALNLDVILKIEVVFKSKIEDVLEYLKGGSEVVDLIIVASMVNEKHTAVEIYKHLQTYQMEIPLVSMEKDSVGEKVIRKLDPDRPVEEIVSEMAQILQIAPVLENESTPEFFPIPIKYYYFIDEIFVHTYIRIKKENNPDHYVMRFRKGDMYIKGDIKKYYEKGVSFFYVKFNDRLYFVNEVTDRIISKLQSELSDDAEKIALLEDCNDIVSGLLLTRGISDETVKLAKASMKKMEEIVYTYPKLGDLLKLLLNNPTSFRFRRTQLTTYVAFHIVSNMEWGSTEQQEKLSFVAYFHDITLQCDKYAMIKNNEEVIAANLNQFDEQTIVYHAKKAAELVRDYPRLPIGADTIILRHHGTMGGRGFAKTFSNNLEPLTVVFLIAEAYANYLLEYYGNITNAEIMDELNIDFPKSQYRKIIKTLVNFEF